MNIILLAGILGLAQARPQQANIEPDSNGFYHMGDMMLSPGQYQEAYGETDKSLRQSGRKDDKYRWENKVLLYAFKRRSIVPENKDKVREVIERFNDEMSHCVQIKEAEEADEDFVTVQAGEGCSSNVGKLGGEQFLTLDDGCFSDGTIIHEFIHAFGFYHEQNRADRDKYVEIKEEFIKENKEHNFKKRTNTLTFGLPYDGLSIMHYGSNYFSVDTHNPEKKTIISKMNEISTNELGKSKWLTDIDVQKLEKMYNCKSKPKQACPTSDPYYAFFNGKCHYFEIKGMNRTDARANCETKMARYGKGRLVEPKSVDMSQKLARKAREIGVGKEIELPVEQLPILGQIVLSTLSSFGLTIPVIRWYIHIGVTRVTPDTCTFLVSSIDGLGEWVDLPCSYEWYSICE